MMNRLSDNTMLLAAIAIIATLAAMTGIHWGLTLLALITMAALSLVNPALGVAFVVASIPVQSVIMLPFLRGELTVTQVFMFGLIAGWGVIFWRRRIWVDSVVVGFLAVMAAFVISFVATDTLSLWFQETYRWVIAGVLYVIARSVLASWRDVIPTLWAITLGVLAVSAHSVYQFVVRSGPEHFQAQGSTRVFSTFGTPNTLAAYLEFTVPLLVLIVAVTLRFRSESFVPRPLMLAMMAAIGSGTVILLLTQSRGGLVGFAGAMLVLWFWLPGKWRIASTLVFFVLLVSFALTGPGQSQLTRFTKLMESEETTYSVRARTEFQASAGRAQLWGAALGMLEDHPLTGVGAGEFDEHFRDYTTSWLFRFPAGQAHNVWLQMGAQAGIPGILGYATWFFASVWSIITARRRSASVLARAIITGVLAVFAAYALHSLVDYLNVLSLGLQLSVLTAIALNLAPEPLTRYSPADDPTTNPTIAVAVA